MPGSDICKVGFTGCTGVGVVALRCPREGRYLWLCGSCQSAWRLQVQTGPKELVHRCPGCASLDLGRANAVAPVRQATTPEPLSGVVARVFDRAMFMDNVPKDVRERVLARVRMTDGWLENVTELADTRPGVTELQP